jgi:hypothetical protein
MICYLMISKKMMIQMDQGKCLYYILHVLALYTCTIDYHIFYHSVSDIRDDIMSPRTVTNTNMTSTGTIETSELHKNHPTE